MALPAEIKLTDEDFFVLCKEDQKAELINGEMIISSPASYSHEMVFNFLLRLLGDFVSHKRLGVVLGSRTAVQFTKFNVYEPDICFISEKNKHRIHETYIEGPCDVVVEIISPGSEKYDRVIKKGIYEQFGVKEYWLIDPYQQEAEFYRLENNTYASIFKGKSGVYHSEVVNDFWMKVEWIWTQPSVFDVLKEIIG